jgi:GTP-binding protein HflX
LERDEYGRISRIRISARTGEGLDLIKQVLVEHQQQIAEHSSVLPVPHAHV